MDQGDEPRPLRSRLSATRLKLVEQQIADSKSLAEEPMDYFSSDFCYLLFVIYYLLFGSEAQASYHWAPAP